MSSNSTLNYLSIERNLGSNSVGSNKPTDASYSFFERSSLSYVLPVIPLSRGKEKQSVKWSEKGDITVCNRLGLSSKHAINNKNASYIGFFETGSKRPKISNFKHWWRDTPETILNHNKLRSLRVYDSLLRTSLTSISQGTQVNQGYQHITWPQCTIQGTQEQSFQQTSMTGNRKQIHNKEISSLTQSLRIQEQVYSLIKTQIHSWNWLIWNFERHQVITGRICRPLQRAGFCVLLGGFPVFLPYAQFRQLQSFTHKKEGSLQSFQISSLSSVSTQRIGSTTGDILRKFPTYNCVVSRDQFVRRIGQYLITKKV